MGLNIIRAGHGLRIAVGITMMTSILLAGALSGIIATSSICHVWRR